VAVVACGRIVSTVCAVPMSPSATSAHRARLHSDQRACAMREVCVQSRSNGSCAALGAQPAKRSWPYGSASRVCQQLGTESPPNPTETRHARNDAARGGSTALDWVRYG